MMRPLKIRLITVLFFFCKVIFSFGQDMNLKDSLALNTIQKDENKKEERFKLSGYVQGQYQLGEKDASLKVGNSNSESGESFNRMGIRRGRIKLEYGKDIFFGVFQVDLTEKGIGIKDAYLGLSDPWNGSSFIRVGVFNRPFGYEVSYSSSKRAAPERARVITSLFPEERDLGAMVSLQTAESSPWHMVKFEAAVISGNGIKRDSDSRKDFVGHLSAQKSIGEQTRLSGGVSYYRGGVYQSTAKVFKMEGNGFVPDEDENNLGKYAKREYFGADIQFEIKTRLGKTVLTGEYIFGTQPGEINNSTSPNYAEIPQTDTYIRDFRGGYFGIIQDLGNTNLSAVLKYDFYNPNTKVSKNDIGLNNTGKGDISFQTFGAGIIWEIYRDFRLTAYYDRIWNETSINLNGYNKDLADNVFTLRMQYKF